MWRKLKSSPNSLARASVLPEDGGGEGWGEDDDVETRKSKCSWVGSMGPL